MSYLYVFLHSAALAAVLGCLLWHAVPRLRLRPLVAGVATLVVAIHALWATMSAMSGAWSVAARWLVTAWLGTLVVAAIVLVPFTLACLLRQRLARRGYGGIRTVMATVVLALAGGIFLASGNLGDPVVREETVHIDGLPPALAGLRIANVGDAHIGAFILPADLARDVDIINNRHVDLLAVTGDLIDDTSQLAATMDALARSDATPVVAILGNHDKKNQPAVVAALLGRRPGIALLVNQSMLVHVRGGTLRVVGADFPMGRRGGHLPPKQRNAAMGRFAEAAFADVQPGETVVALSHHPDFFPLAAAHGAVLTLASHTHGGQLGFDGRSLVPVYHYAHGPYQLGHAHLDVSAGVGHWFPLRLGMPREIVIVTLR
jgi:predicted MPP superfamily phosphohydrolase